MVNAGIAIRGFDGQQTFDYDVGMWVGIGVKVNYPLEQNVTDNPISVGDVLLEQNGQAWKVEQVELEDAGQGFFRLALTSMTGETTEEQTPTFGDTLRGGITTPRNGFIAPYWDSMLVSEASSRLAQVLTMQTFELPEAGDELPEDVWSGTVDLG